MKTSRPWRWARPSAPALPISVQRDFWLWITTSSVAIVLFSVSVPLSAALYQVHVLAAFAVGLLQCASIPVALVAPRLAVASWIVGTTAFIAFGTSAQGAPWPLAVPGLLSLCALLMVLGLRQPLIVGVIAWALSAAASMQVLLYIGIGAAKFASVDGIVANIVTTTAISALALCVAIPFAQREQMRGELVAEQQRRVIVEERNRIARELHDVVAHSMSVIQVQSSSAPFRLPQLDEETRREFAEIAASARLAMQEMRRLLGVLRSEGSSGEGMPQPGIAQLALLIPAIERTGSAVTVDLSPELPTEGLASTAAYRIAQESLSNVVRHAPGARVRVFAELVGGAILLCVENDAPAAPVAGVVGAGDVVGQRADGPRQPGEGHGLIGMRERCSMLGGTLNAGQTAEGGYRVLATLPIAASAPPDVPTAPDNEKDPDQP